MSIARSGSRRCLPCRFMLVVAANPCPCGRGETDNECECTQVGISRYAARLSGALADRIDIVSNVEQPTAKEMGGDGGEPSAAVRDRVLAARERQEARLGAGRCNAWLTAGELRAERPDPDAADLLERSYAEKRLSGRGHDRVLRLARTAADLDGSERIGSEHVERALFERRRETR